MTDTSNPIVASTFSIFSGAVTGTLADRLITLIHERKKLADLLGLSPTTGNLLDAALGIFLQVGMISLGTKFATTAMPFLTQDAASFTLFIMGVWTSSKTLTDNLRTVTSIILTEPKEVETVPTTSS